MLELRLDLPSFSLVSIIILGHNLGFALFCTVVLFQQSAWAKILIQSEKQE